MSILTIPFHESDKQLKLQIAKHLTQIYSLVMTSTASLGCFPLEEQGIDLSVSHFPRAIYVLLVTPTLRSTVP